MFSQKIIQTNSTSHLFFKNRASQEKSNQKLQKLFQNRPATQSPFHARCHAQSDKQNFLQKNQVKLQKANVLTQKFNSLQIRTKVQKQIKQHKKKIKLNLRNFNVIQQNEDNSQIQQKVLKRKKSLKNFKQLEFDKVIKQNMDEITYKMEKQSSYIRRSLQKFQKTIEEKIQKILVPKKQTEFVQKQRIQKNVLQTQKIEQLQSEIQKLYEQIKGLKSVNTFLTSQNYKILLQNNILKQQIIEAQQRDYSQCNDQESISEEGSFDKIQAEDILILKNQIQALKQLNQKLNNQNVKLKLQNNDQAQEIAKLKKQVQQINDQASRKIDQLMLTHQEEIKNFKFQICQLERQANDKFIQNINLATRLSKIGEIHAKNIQQAKIQVRNQDKVKTQKKKSHSIVSISIKSKKGLSSSMSQQQVIKSQFDLSEKQKKDLSPTAQKVNQKQKVSYKPIKSQILSNRILNFVQVEKVAQKKQNNKKKERVSFSVYNSQKSISKKNKLNIDPSQCLSRRRRSLSKAVSFKIQQQSLKKTKFKSAINFYSVNKINQLKIIRQSISLKFQAFKYTFELFQNQMINWPQQKVTQKQITKILQQYPFFLDEVSIQLIINYCDPEDKKQIFVGVFTNKMRQFIQDYDQISEQDEVVIQKKINKRWKYAGQEIIGMFKKLQQSQGIITKDILIQILSEMKFQKKQIQYLLCQIASISKNINHMKYLQYFTQIFVSKK